jgi:hypothetical protein
MTPKQKKIVAISAFVSIFVGLIVLAIIIGINRSKKLSKRDLIKIVRDDVEYWENVKETDPAGAEKLKLWWSWLGFNYSIAQLMTASFQNNHYWSAVYISALMKRWGAGNRFKYSASHSQYIVDGKKARETNDKTRIFHSYRPNEVKVEVGDIVGKSRQTGINYDNIYVGAPTHTDVVYDVVNKDGTWYAYLIGGNLANTVQIKAVELDDNKMLKDPETYLVVMKNQVA